MMKTFFCLQKYYQCNFPKLYRWRDSRMLKIIETTIFNFYSFYRKTNNSFSAIKKVRDWKSKVKALQFFGQPVENVRKCQKTRQNFHVSRPFLLISEVAIMWEGNDSAFYSRDTLYLLINYNTISCKLESDKI